MFFDEPFQRVCGDPYILKLGRDGRNGFCVSLLAMGQYRSRNLERTTTCIARPRWTCRCYPACSAFALDPARYRAGRERTWGGEGRCDGMDERSGVSHSRHIAVGQAETPYQRPGVHVLRPDRQRLLPDADFHPAFIL